MAVIFGEKINSKQIAVMALTEDDWDIADAAAEAHQLTAHPVPSKPPGALIFPLTWPTVTQLAHQYCGPKHQWQVGPELDTWITVELIRRTATPQWNLQTSGWTPMEHQKTGALAIASTGKFYLMDEMGTGKTRSVLLGLRLLQQSLPAIVIAPASVVDVWLEEIAAACPDWKAVAYRGPRRHELAGTADIYAMSYDIMRNDMKNNRLRFLNQRTVIFDEAHALCAYGSKQAQEGRRLAAKTANVICTSGTPITKNIGSFWSALRIIDKESWPDRNRFKNRFLQEGYSTYGEDIQGLDKVRQSEFRTCMLGLMRRVAKADVLDLPPKTYTRRMVEIPEDYRLAYDEMREDMLAHLPDNDEPLEVMSILAQLIRLSQLAATACDVSYEETDEWDEMRQEFKVKTIVKMREPSWKIDELMKIRDELDSGEPLVVFSPSRQLIDLAGTRAEKEGWRVGYIVGGMADGKRKQVRLDFQDGKYDILCAVTKAGGLGLTLTRASTTVFLSRPWSLVESSQAEDRTHRKGQEKPVNIIDIVARDTVDKRVFLGLKDKAKHFSELVQDPRIVRELLGG